MRRRFATLGPFFIAAGLVACDAEPSPTPALLTSSTAAFVGVNGSWHAAGPGHVAIVRDGVLFVAASSRDPVVEGVAIRSVRIEREHAGHRTLGHRAIPRDATGPVRLVRFDGCTEELVNRDDGVEQRWHFERPPEGSGDLSVEVEAEGSSLVSSSGLGLHLRASNGLRFRYGHATWIDADGAITRVPSRWNGRAVVLEVPARVVDESSYPVVLDPIIGPETEIDPPVLSVSASSQHNAASAFDGSAHLVAWIDARDGTYDLYAARVSATGSVIDDYGIRLGDSVHGNVAVGPGAGGWLVVWAPAAPTSAGGLESVWIAADGTVLGTPTTLLSPISDGPRDVRIAFDGTGYLVTYQSSYRVYGLRLLSDGSASGSPFPISGTTSAQRHELAWGGGRYLVVWDAGDNIAGARVAADGSLLDATPIAITSDSWQQLDPAVASDGSGFLVAWQDARDVVSAGLDIWGTSIDGSGAVGTPFVVGGATADQQMPSAAFDGTSYHVTWEDGRDPLRSAIYGGRVTTGGALLDGTGVRIDDTPVEDTMPRLSNASGAVLALWDGESNLLARVVTAAGAPAAPSEYVATAGNGHDWPAIAEGTSGYLVAWTDYRNWPDWGDIYAARLDLDGNPVGAAIPLAVGPGSQEGPSVAFDGTAYLVAWSHYDGPDYDIHGARIDAAGTVLDPGGRALVVHSGDQATAAVSHDGASWLVAWFDGRSGGTSGRADIYAARFDASLASMDGTGFALSSIGRAQWPVYATAVAGTHFVVWKMYVPASTAIEPRGARIVGGSVLDPEGLSLGGRTPFGADADGSSFTVLSESRFDQLVATRITTSGAITTHTLFTGPDLYAGDVTWDGSSFLAVFHERGRSVDRVRGLRYSPAGTLVDAMPFDVLPSGDSYFLPRVASAGGGRSAIAYKRWVPGAPYDAWRVSTRASSDGLLPDAGLSDAGLDDAGSADAGVADAGPLDAGALDGSVADAGPLDAGVLDSGVLDAGSTDAGGRDARIEPLPDAGTVDDAGHTPRPRDEGCGCRVLAPRPARAPTAVLVALLLVGSLGARRRARRRGAR